MNPSTRTVIPNNYVSLWVKEFLFRNVPLWERSTEIFLEDEKQEKTQNSELGSLYMYKYMYKFQKLIYVGKYSCVFIYIGQNRDLNLDMLYYYLTAWALRKGRKGGRVYEKRLFLCRFQSGWNSKVSEFSQTAFFSKVSWPSLDTPRGRGKHLTFWAHTTLSKPF